MSKHHDQQNRWTEEIIGRLLGVADSAIHFKWSQEQYLAKRNEVMADMKRLTGESKSYVYGYLRAMEKARIDAALVYVLRIRGRPETATSARWNDLPAETREAARNHNVENCLAWDAEGKFPYSPWSGNTL